MERGRGERHARGGVGDGLFRRWGFRVEQWKCLGWGYYSATTEVAPVTMYCEMLAKPKELTIRSESETLEMPVAELETLKLVTRVGDDMRYLALLVVGMARYERKDYSGAVEVFSRALDEGTAPADMVSPADLYCFRGKAYAKLGNCETALEDLNKAIAADNNHVQAHSARSVLFMLRGEFEKAIKDCDRTVALSPADSSSYVDRGFVELLSGRVFPAIEDYKMAVHLDGTDEEAHTGLGVCLLAVGETASAISELDKALSHDKSSKWARVNRTFAYVMDDDLDNVRTRNNVGWGVWRARFALGKGWSV
jgi:tetratricopeptide (TPR) repeat protein